MDSPGNLLQPALVRARGSAALAGTSPGETCLYVTHHSCQEPGTSRNYKIHCTWTRLLGRVSDMPDFTCMNHLCSTIVRFAFASFGVVSLCSDDYIPKHCGFLCCLISFPLLIHSGLEVI